MTDNPDDINGRLQRIFEQLRDLTEAQQEVGTSQTRMEGQITTLIERSGEDRARIGVAEGNIVALFRRQDVIEDRQTRKMVEQTGISAILATVAGVVAAIVGVNK